MAPKNGTGNNGAGNNGTGNNGTGNNGTGNNGTGNNGTGNNGTGNNDTGNNGAGNNGTGNNGTNGKVSENVKFSLLRFGVWVGGFKWESLGYGDGGLRLGLRFKGWGFEFGVWENLTSVCHFYILCHLCTYYWCRFYLTAWRLSI